MLTNIYNRHKLIIWVIVIMALFFTINHYTHELTKHPEFTITKFGRTYECHDATEPLAELATGHMVLCQHIDG